MNLVLSHAAALVAGILLAILVDRLGRWRSRREPVVLDFTRVEPSRKVRRVL